MWKFLPRSLKEKFERTINVGKHTSVRVNRENKKKQSCICRCYSPANAIKLCQTGTKKKCEESYKTKDGAREDRIPPYNYFEDIFGAFSYSSALVLGWVLTQPYHRWKKWWEVECDQKFCQPIPRSILPFIARIAISQPSLPFNQEVPLVNINNEIEGTSTYGPLTAEEALEEAAEELRSVHNSVVGEVENRQGVDCIGRGENRKALELFRSATERGYAPAAYNLAHCHELGLGTKQDFSKAAKWYQVAANWGHPIAMYNLGVFYAHGWGGLESNGEVARQLFSRAAAQGQPDARAALGLDQPPTPPPSIIEESDWEFSDFELQDTNKCSFDNDPEQLYNLGLSFENSFGGSSSDPYLILQMYSLASELGHKEAKSRLNILKAYDAVGLLQEFFMQRKSKHTEAVRVTEEARSVP